MRFLITGLPRIRSAWFSALLECQHDAGRTCWRGESLSDPSVACLYPERASWFDRVVVIERAADDSRKAFEKAWVSVSDAFWDQCIANVRVVMERKPMTIGFNHLNDEAVSAICNYVGRPQSMDKIRDFQMLRIESCLGR